VERYNFYNFVDVVDVRPCLFDLMFLLAKFKTRKPKVAVKEKLLALNYMLS
jgi:hypothetical protein